VVAGLANATEYSGYEPAARNFYNQQVQVPLQCHAVDRSRYVVCSAFDWPLITRGEEAIFYPDKAILPAISQQIDSLHKPYVLFFIQPREMQSGGLKQIGFSWVTRLLRGGTK